MKPDHFFDAFSIIFAILITLLLIAVPALMGWLIGSVVQKIILRFEVLRMKPIVTMDEETRRAIKDIRDAQDAARLARIRQQRTIKIEPALFLPGPPVKHEPTREPLYLICNNPLSDNPTYFHSVRKGYFSHVEAEHIRPEIFLTDLRSCAHRMTLREAEKALRLFKTHDSGKKSKFVIVPEKINRTADPLDNGAVDLTAELNTLSEEVI